MNKKEIENITARIKNLEEVIKIADEFDGSDEEKRDVCGVVTAGYFWHHCGEGAYCKGKLAMLKEIIGGQ